MLPNGQPGPHRARSRPAGVRAEGNLWPWNGAKDADLMSCYGNRTYAVLLVNSGRQAVTTAVPLALGPSVAGEELHPDDRISPTRLHGAG